MKPEPDFWTDVKGWIEWHASLTPEERQSRADAAIQWATDLSDADICNPIVHKYDHMRCGTCGKLFRACECGKDVIRAITCERCGFRFITGGRSLGELLEAPSPKPS